MERNQGHSLSFFKVLMGDFCNRLPIPPRFVMKLKGKLPRAPVLRTKCGRSWEVNIKEYGHKYCFMDGGWLKFVNYHKLEMGDFLVFWLIDGSTFQVAIYDRSCCEKESNSSLCGSIPPNTQIIKIKEDDTSNPDDDNDDDDDTDDDSDDEAEDYHSPKTEDPFFELFLKKTHKMLLHLPRHFLRETGLIKKRSTRLRDPKGKVWQANLVTDAKNRVHLTEGWTRLRRANKIDEGDKCVFTFIRSERNLIQVELPKKPVDNKKRGRGRPPKSSS